MWLFTFAKTIESNSRVDEIDNDGDIDVYIVNLEDEGILLRNDKGNQNNWLILNLTGKTCSRDAIGARVQLTAGGITQEAQKKGGSGYLSQNDPRLHFGLGSASVVDELIIFWPSGKKQVLEQVDAGQILDVTEPD